MENNKLYVITYVTDLKEVAVGAFRNINRRKSIKKSNPARVHTFTLSHTHTFSIVHDGIFEQFGAWWSWHGFVSMLAIILVLSRSIVFEVACDEVFSFFCTAFP